MFKRLFTCLISIFILHTSAFAITYTPNYSLGLPARGEAWLVPWNTNYSTIDSLLAQAAKVYEMTGTFNGPTGRVLTLPVAVDAVTDYTIAITPNPKAAGAVGDVSVVQGTTTFTVYCSQSNTTDTFEASVIYVGSSAAFTDSLAQVCMVTTEAEMISTDASTTSCAMWYLSGSFTLTAARTITKPMIPLKGFEITTTAANTLTFSTGYVYGKPRHQAFVSLPGEVTGLHYANPDMFGAVADWNGTTGTNDYNAIQCALGSGAQNVELLTGRAYAIESSPTITQDGQRFYAESRATTEDSTNGGKLVWTGADATNMLIIGSTGAAVATSPIQIENIYFDGQDTCLYAIYSNRMNALSEIRGCFFYRTPGFIKALDCWYLTLEDLHMYGVAAANQGATPLALSAAYADLDDGSLILNAANRVNVNRVAISHMNITIDGTRQSYIINSNRQENLKFGILSTEDVHPADAVIYFDSSSQGENVTIDHWYIENVDGTALVSLGTYAKQGIDINNIHLYQTHIGNVVRSGSTSNGPNVRVRRLEFVDFVSMTKVFYASNSNYANFILEDSFIAPGYKVYDTDHYVIKPYGGETVTNSAGYVYTTKDNRLGMTTTGTRRDVSNYGFSNIGSGFATTYSGTESRDFGAGAITVPYIDLVYDGYNIVVNGEPMFLSKRYVDYYRVRFYPTENGASTDWEMRLGRLGQLWIEVAGTTTNNAGSTPVLQFNVTAADEVDAGTIDTTVRRPPGLPLNYSPGNMLVSDSDPSLAAGDYTFLVGDIWMRTSQVSLYGIGGKICTVAGNPGTWKTMYSNPVRSEAPAADTSFAGTISAAATTATFSSTADYTSCQVGDVIVAGGNTRYVLRKLGSDQVTLDQTTTWGAGTAITSIQEAQFVSMDEAGNVNFLVAADGAKFALSDVGAVLWTQTTAGLFGISDTDPKAKLQISAGNNTPLLDFYNTAGTVDKRRFAMIMYVATDTLLLQCFNDAGAYISNALSVRHSTNALGIGTLMTPADGSNFLLFSNGTKPSGMSNEAGLFAKDVAGTTEMHSFDEAGNETLISAHAGDAPDWMYDVEDGVPMIVREAQYFLGTVRYSNRTRADRLLELTDAEKTLLPIEKRRVTFTETFAEHNARLGLTGEKALVKLDWEAEQDKVTAVMAGRKQAVVDRLATINVRLAELDVPKALVETEGLSEEEAAKALAADAAETAKIEDERKKLTAEKESTQIPDDHIRKPLPKHLDRAMKAREK